MILHLNHTSIPTFTRWWHFTSTPYYFTWRTTRQNWPGSMIWWCRADSTRRMKLLRDLASTLATTMLMDIYLAYVPHLYLLYFTLGALHLYPLLFLLADHPISLLIVKIWKICNFSPWTCVTFLWDCCKHMKYVSKWPYDYYKSSFLISKHNGAISLSLLLIAIFWSFLVIISHDLTLLFNLFITIYPNRTRFWKLIYLWIYIPREQIFGNWYIYQYISKEKKYPATDIFASFENIKARLWLIFQWFKSTLSTLVSMLPSSGSPILPVV